MSQDNNNMAANHSGSAAESIDLIDIVIQLWKGKVVVFSFVILFIILAVVWLLVAKEKWTSTAVIAQPDAAQIATYNNALDILYGNAAPNINDIQNRVVGRFNSAISALSEALENQEVPEDLTVEPSVKGQPMPLKISYVGDSAENAKITLAKYIQKVDEQIGEELALDLKDNIKLQITTLTDSLQTQEAVAAEQKALRLKQIGEALKFATEAKITTPQVQQTQDVTQDTMALLGSETLASMIKNESTRPLVFSPAYYQTKQNLLDIQGLKIEPTTIHAYRYVMKPTLPVHRDSPKRGLTLVLAVLLGGLIGAGVVLGRNALRDYKVKA